MVFLGNRWVWTLPLLLGMAMALTPTAGAACSLTETGALLVATFNPNPPPFATSANDGINVYFVDPILAGTNYELNAIATPAHVQVLSVDVYLPDFNVAWYKNGSPFDTQVANHATLGNQIGVIPSTADYGLVYMRYGPDVLGSDSNIGASFTLGMNC